MADKDKLLRPEAELDARPSDASGWVWNGDDVDEREDQRTQRNPAEVWARHDAALTAAPEIALFGNVEVNSVSDPITLTILNRAQTPVELEAPTIRAGTSNDGHVPVDEFVVAKPSTTTVALGRPAMLAVAFAPKHVAGSRSTLHVKGRAGSQPVDLHVSLRGQGVKQRRDDDPSRPVHAEQRESRRASWDSRGIAEKHAAPATHTYAEMLTTVLAAQRLTDSGSKDDHAHAREMLLVVSRRLHELAPVARERLRDFGWGHNPGVEVFDHATASIDDWVHKLGLGGSIETAHLVTAFEVGAEEIRLVTGERSDAPNLRTLHEASKLTPPAIAGAMVGGAAIGALIGSAPALVGAIGEEAGLLSLAVRGGGQRLLLWGAAHPFLAVELVSSFVGVGTAVNSWDDFVQALQDPREAMFLLMQVALELMHLHQARGAGASRPASSNARASSNVDERAIERELLDRIRSLRAQLVTIENDRDGASAQHAASRGQLPSVREHEGFADRVSGLGGGEKPAIPGAPSKAPTKLHALSAEQLATFKALVRNHDDHAARVRELRANPIIGPQIAGIPDEELIAVLGYTDTDYRMLNRPLREGDHQEIERLNPYIKLLENVLQRLPAHVGTVYRGTTLSPDKLNAYVPGAVIEETGFTSTSYDRNQKFDGNVLFEIHSETGKQIDFLSHFPHEREVLMSPGTRLRIISRGPDPTGQHAWHIVCEEVL